MEELNNGVKLCKLIGALQTKIAQSCPSALCQVSQTGGQKIARCPQEWTGAEALQLLQTVKLRIRLGADLIAFDLAFWPRLSFRGLMTE